MMRRLLPILFLAAISSAAQTSAQSSETQKQQPADLRLEHADVPMYPPVARVARIVGTVEVQVTVKDGVVSNTEVKSSAQQMLVNAAIENIKSWRFHSYVNTTFTTKFVYQLARKEQLLADPKIELQLPLLVKLTTKPPLLDTSRGSTATMDPNTGNVHLTAKPSRWAEVRPPEETWKKPGDRKL